MRKFVNGRYVDLKEDEKKEAEKFYHALDHINRTRQLSSDEVLAKIIPQTINTVEVDDNTALRMIGYYPEWTVGVTYAVGFKVQRNDKLWRTLQAHTSQATWEPENAASLWTQICETHDGTEEDPIPYEGNMALKDGKYYIQNNVIYLCIQDTINPVYHNLSELVGIYVKEIDI